MPDPQISAIVCTHNRDKYLGAAIDSLLRQEFAAEFEVVVVDNASIDRTRDVVEQRMQAIQASPLPHPSLKYVYETVTGLSVARNTGARESSGQILAYLDDDAVASPRWLQILDAAYQSNEKLAIAGGKVTLLWPAGMTPPRWLSSELAGNLGAYDLGETLVYIDRPGLTPRGLNYSIRRSFLDQVGGFNISLGRIGKKLLSNEELHMTELALQLGWQVAYLPTATVAHNVASERVKLGWFLSRGWWQGISECYREQVAGRAGVGQLGRGGERLVRGIYKSLQHLPDPAERFDKLVYTYSQVGYLSAAIQGLLFTRKRTRED